MGSPIATSRAGGTHAPDEHRGWHGYGSESGTRSARGSSERDKGARESLLDENGQGRNDDNVEDPQGNDGQGDQSAEGNNGEGSEGHESAEDDDEGDERLENEGEDGHDRDVVVDERLWNDDV